METFVEFIGIIATILLTTAYLPPLIRIIRTKDYTSVNKSMFTILLMASMLWLVVSIYKESVSLILCNSITFIESFIILTLTRYNNRKIKNIKKWQN